LFEICSFCFSYGSLFTVNTAHSTTASELDSEHTTELHKYRVIMGHCESQKSHRDIQQQMRPDSF